MESSLNFVPIASSISKDNAAFSGKPSVLNTIGSDTRKFADLLISRPLNIPFKKYSPVDGAKTPVGIVSQTEIHVNIYRNLIWCWAGNTIAA